MKYTRHQTISLLPLLLVPVFALTVFFTGCKKDKDEEKKRKIKKTEKELCDDTCVFSGDGECDDGGDGSTSNYCGFGKDCTDCGTRIVVEVKH